jgi:hypothetical protein
MTHPPLGSLNSVRGVATEINGINYSSPRSWVTYEQQESCIPHMPAPQEKKLRFSRVADNRALLRIAQSGHFDHLGRIKNKSLLSV